MNLTGQGSPERKALIQVGACAALLLTALCWASWAGLRLGSLRREVRKEVQRDDLVTKRMQDMAFREQLAVALRTLSEDDTPFRTRLVTQLRVLELEGRLAEWDDRRIEGGDDWYPEIVAAIL